MSKEMCSTLKVLPPFLGSRLEIDVRGDNRTTKYTEAVTLSEDIFKQASVIGKNLVKVSQLLPELLKSSYFRQRIGVSEERFKNKIEPFLKNGESIGFFGADAIVDKNQKIKLIEINTRPQSLGRFDEITPLLIGQEDPNGRISPEYKTLLDNSLSPGKSAVIISHPSNTFHNYHLLLGKQVDCPVASMQELTVGSGDTVELRGKEVGTMIRQFNINMLFNPELTNEVIVQSISNGRINLTNGPVVSVMGDKPFFPVIPEIVPDIADYFPQMRIHKTGDEIALEDYWGWWLKGETGGHQEITLQIDKNELSGWRRQTIKAMLMGDYKLARNILEGRENQTATRFRSYLAGQEANRPPSWLLQENVEPHTVSVDENNQISSLFSMLRIYFVPNRSPHVPPSVHLEMFLKDTPRVSAAGLIVPVRSGGINN